MAKLTNKHLHIVSFDVPFPADYGGAVDVFHRIVALHKLGVKIILHCFEYGRGEQVELEKYTEKVYYYPRKKSVLDTISKTPFIVKSRNSEVLLENLIKDNFPILFEGLHTCFFLDDPKLKNRTKIVRTHNIEHEYYFELSKHNSGLKKTFYASESKKLEAYEIQLKNADHILAIKNSDAIYFKTLCDSVFMLPASSEDRIISEQKETYPYCLFHGNLSVAENSIAAIWLIENVFSPIDRNNQLKIAGKDPGSDLIKLCSDHKVELIANPSEAELESLIQATRVHVFYSEQSTGVKLKLVNALASSGHVIVNDNMILGTNLMAQCSLAQDNIEFQQLILEKLKSELSEEEFQSRIAFLKDHFSSEKNCKIILDLI